ncbi:MAG TPA: pyridoxal phosphate-dependent aminotransferase [Ktedonobacteraceae bacterium]|jgi:aspartate/methionine/tyrosine aminotransferase|nr:pyridoxal phosphate-dependent aminotransferase [Ktedonobacteraceae bacterium]
MPHEPSTDSYTILPATPDEQRTLLRQLRSEYIHRYRPHIMEGPGPIRVMARIVAELAEACRQQGISEEIISAEIVNRTIGDIDLRRVVECEGAPGGEQDYRTLADELGIALPGEMLHGYQATGDTYLWLREHMQIYERQLLAQNYDLRIYDIYGVGNPVLRSWLAEEMQCWGLPVTFAQINLGIGAMDCIDKVLRGLAHLYRTRGLDMQEVAVLFPEPGFHVPEWQARMSGYRLQHFPTRPEHHFRLTAQELDQLLQAHADIRIIYLTVTNNPTTLAYTAAELRALHAVLRAYYQKGREILILADLAYIGTGRPEEDMARMQTFSVPDILQHTIFVSSLSKTYTLTGERFGWVTCGDPQIASSIVASWTNTMATLPGEWQLRFMAYYRLLQERPWLAEKLRKFYRLRRERFIAQLHAINEQQPLFREIYIDDDATVYNWSRLLPGEDAFSVFEKIGIAGVPGSGFGYSDDYIRFSIGVIPVPPCLPSTSLT